MNFIITLLKEAKESKQTVAVITEEGTASYKNYGIVKEISETDILMEKHDGKKSAIRISNIVKVED